MLLDVAYFGTCSNNCSLILALSRDWYLNTYVASLLHLIFFNDAEEPVQHEEKRLATWGTDVPDDLVLDKKKLDESLKKVSITSLSL
jgi:hypothetical protein